MLMADAMEGSIFFPDASADGGSASADNLEISVEDFFQILDEPGAQNGFHQGLVAANLVDPNGEFHHQADSAAGGEDFVSSWESPDYMAEPDYNVERSRGLHSEPVEISNNLSGIFNPSHVDNGNLHSLEHGDLKNLCFYPSNYSSEWSPSLGQNSFFTYSVDESFDASIPDNFEQHQLHKNVVNSSAPAESAEGVGLIHSHDADFMNDLHFNSEQDEDFMQQGVMGLFQRGVKGSDSNVNTMSSLSVLQNGETVSSHAMQMDKSSSNDEFQSNLNTSFIPDSGVQEGNPSPFLYSSMSADAPLAEVDYAGVIPSGTAYTTCDVSNSCLSVPVPRGSTTVLDNALRRTVPDTLFHPFVSVREAVDHRMVKREDQVLPYQKTCRRSEVKITTQKDSLDTLLDARNLDTDASILEMPSTKLNQSQDTSFKSESSTDSSPIPSRRSSSTFDNICRSTISKSNYLAPDLKTIMLNRKKNAVLKEERKDQMCVPYYNQYDISKVDDDDEDDSDAEEDDDDDVCIIDDRSNPIHPVPPLIHTNPRPLLTFQSSGLDGPHYTGLAALRLKSDDERLTFRIALQGLSQPKTEATPPDGVLAVPLLRHQRIALSWMVQKETASLNCCGGILADDQGLGKTVSTIALILMERSPSPRSYSPAEKHDECEALNLDDDDDDDGGDFDHKLMKQPRNGHSTIMDMPVKRNNRVTVVRHRPAAGTLVVCPTSVLRQWADELQNKVTSKANLSFLVYHGSNRTKDPIELAKYDVVLTTYAIVSMEVPKQPLVDKDDEDKVRLDQSCFSMGSKKRKSSPNTKESALLESAARPLAKVGWFRVILDEAQSIKNHRTQVARACWGLRAKRRWCLSGTPIQNAVDDLYSYFRFLRYDPYAVYKSFCSTIKMPISRNPTNGYRKLQAVLKTIMLRRTKGTLIDGTPIIILPPKTVTMKKVDFSSEERAFYSTLESESREQFKEYAAAGTVKQNYVNILLMLLRLRQACDHPLLVKWSDSNSTQRAMEMVNKLPRDKQVYLLNCLEACLAICTLCNDPPEDAVVTVCGHVFCNQCISDRLTGDDNICPSAQCKVRLTVASVFSRGTLKNSLSAVPNLDCCNGDSSLEGPDESKLHENIVYSDSSKIKAAVEILRSLPKSFPESNFEGSATQPIESTVPVIHSKDICDRKHSKLKNNSSAERSEKAIVFSQWTRMLDLLEVPLRGSCIKYRRLDGTMSVSAREKAIKDFNTLPEVTVMIMSLKAASLGLNMVAACHVLLLDLWWNPTTEDQAIDRAHRIGQTRPVTVSRLTVKDTVEDRILALQEKKREMVASAFGEDESGSRQTRLTEEDLKYLFMV